MMYKSIELEQVFHLLSKHLKFRNKYSAARRFLISFPGVWISRWNTVLRVWYITLENSPKKARALIGYETCLYNSMETQN